MSNRITRKQAQTFADEWLAASRRTGTMYDAFTASHVLEWPDDDEDDTPDQARYAEIETEILNRTFAAVKDAVADAFLVAARDVIGRERERRKGQDWP